MKIEGIDRFSLGGVMCWFDDKHRFFSILLENIEENDKNPIKIGENR